MNTLLEIVEYEAGAMSFAQTLWYKMFPKLFTNKCVRKYKRYMEYQSFANKIEITKYFKP